MDKKIPVDCHQCKHGKYIIEEFDTICDLINKSVITCTDIRHSDCPLK